MTEQVNTSPEGIEYSYKLIKGGDGHIYVSVQPLMHDIQVSIDKMQTMDISSLSDENQRIFDLKLLGLTTVYQFLGGFITEQQLKDKAAELKGNIPLNTENTYYPGGVEHVKH
jgi:hypothetical protein